MYLDKYLGCCLAFDGNAFNVRGQKCVCTARKTRRNGASTLICCWIVRIVVIVLVIVVSIVIAILENSFFNMKILNLQKLTTLAIQFGRYNAINKGIDALLIRTLFGHVNVLDYEGGLLLFEHCGVLAQRSNHHMQVLHFGVVFPTHRFSLSIWVFLHGKKHYV